MLGETLNGGLARPLAARGYEAHEDETRSAQRCVALQTLVGPGGNLCGSVIGRKLSSQFELL
eukprot:4975050-Pyramimonas_sp.AAC.2